MKFEFPLLFSCRCFPGPNRAVGFIAVECALSAPKKGLAGFVFRFAFQIVRAHLSCRMVEKFGLRTVRRAVPIRCALQTGINERAFDARLYASSYQRTPFFTEAVGPRLSCVRSTGQELAR